MTIIHCRSSEQLSNLRADIRTLKLQLDPISQSDAQQLRECSEGRSAIQALRNDLHDAEERLAQAEARSKGTDVRTHSVVCLISLHFCTALCFLMSLVSASQWNNSGGVKYLFLL